MNSKETYVSVGINSGSSYYFQTNCLYYVLMSPYIYAEMYVDDGGDDEEQTPDKAYISSRGRISWSEFVKLAVI